MILELQRFLLAAHTGNITRSAEKLFITQSALTQSIQRLEKTLGTKLFMQKGKYLQLTEDGNAIVAIAEKIIKLWENAQSPHLRKTPRKSMSIGMYDNAALRLGSFLQKSLSEEQYSLDLLIEGSTSLLAKLAVGILEAAICVTHPKTVLPKNISLMQTFHEELLPVSAKKFTGTLANVPFIFYNKQSHTRMQTDRVFEKKKISPRVFAESTSTTFMKELARLGSGVALLPENFVRAELAQGTLIKQNLAITWTREFALYITTDNALKKDHPLLQELVYELNKSI
jgi:DNA-binding transcriptional LysR family regulator